MRAFALGWTIAASAMIVIALLVDLPIRLVYNASASAPPGFYWIDDGPVRRGEFVLIHLPASMRDVVLERKYLPPGVPLLKRVYAAFPDRVCRSGGNISVNEVVVARARSEDRLGRKLPVWSGCRALELDEIFVLQDHPDSFDGRYFGPIGFDLVIGRALLLWKHDQN